MLKYAREMLPWDDGNMPLLTELSSRLPLTISPSLSYNSPSPAADLLSRLAIPIYPRNFCWFKKMIKVDLPKGISCNQKLVT
jgi:hypothetical protein